MEKNFKTIDEQIQILRDKGLIIEDEYLNTDEVGIYSHNYIVKKLLFKRNIPIRFIAKLAHICTNHEV